MAKIPERCEHSSNHQCDLPIHELVPRTIAIWSLMRKRRFFFVACSSFACASGLNLFASFATSKVALQAFKLYAYASTRPTW
jgi:hypothetical protein